MNYKFVRIQMFDAPKVDIEISFEGFSSYCRIFGLKAEDVNDVGFNALILKDGIALGVVIYK